MRWPILILLALVVLLQYPLWLGKGGWLRVLARSRASVRPDAASSGTS